ncbi:hypothetical protein CANCADRAFT_144311 [Tortispora caseinolytica NRRL Y-17796]|uniref:Uncharacterized protein n=1 Tax=Tortispora caseinolytica NRRL Y-17796 TaxID=767744 RepID=A0A1E4TDH4_9ASCO|nr:hypothetical protein CANCADRAFT_144311 [Tortispora caseinolytica NRRL Y-17796]
MPSQRSCLSFHNINALLSFWWSSSTETATSSYTETFDLPSFTRVTRKGSKVKANKGEPNRVMQSENASNKNRCASTHVSGNVENASTEDQSLKPSNCLIPQNTSSGSLFPCTPLSSNTDISDKHITPFYMSAKCTIDIAPEATDSSESDLSELAVSPDASEIITGISKLAALSKLSRKLRQESYANKAIQKCTKDTENVPPNADMLPSIFKAVSEVENTLIEIAARESDTSMDSNIHKTYENCSAK